VLLSSRAVHEWLLLPYSLLVRPAFNISSPARHRCPYENASMITLHPGRGLPHTLAVLECSSGFPTASGVVSHVCGPLPNSCQWQKARLTNRNHESWWGMQMYMESRISQLHITSNQLVVIQNIKKDDVTQFMATISFPHVGLACKGCVSGFRILFSQQQLSSEQVPALVDRTYLKRAFRATPVGRTNLKCCRSTKKRRSTRPGTRR